MKTQPLWQSRLRDPEQWKKTLSETIMWTIYALLMMKLIANYSPGYPFLVATPSVHEGIYWRDTRVSYHKLGDVTSFDFNPSQAWIRDRYWTPNQTFTKRIEAVPGDTVTVDKDGNIEVCNRSADSEPACRPHGRVHTKDSDGRELFSWVPLGASYTLKPNEVWLMGTHSRSFDSRYFGPIETSQLFGTAYLLLPWGEDPK